jgi:hypothetical protein
MNFQINPNKNFTLNKDKSMKSIIKLILIDSQSVRQFVQLLQKTRLMSVFTILVIKVHAIGL